MKRRHSGRYAGPEYDEADASRLRECYLDSGTAHAYAVRTGMLSKDSDLDGPEGGEDGMGEPHGEDHCLGQSGDVAMETEAGKSEVDRPEGAGDSRKNGVPSRLELVT